MNRKPIHALLFTLLVVLMLVGLAACYPLPEDLAAVVYTPLVLEDGWEASTPEAEGLDPTLVARLFYNAAELETLYGLLVIKNGYLIAEGYFNKGSVDQLSGRQSVTKSVVSALVGIALEQGHLATVDQEMTEFFPELTDQFSDQRKQQITIRHLLQMRGGYPDEERMRQYLDILFFTDNWYWIPHLVDFPLVSDPGTAFHYSNLTSHALGIVVARGTGTDLESFAQEHLFSPIGADLGDWTRDGDGYNFGCVEIHLTARDMAKFGLLYLNGGKYGGDQVIPAEWVADSLRRYSEGMNFTGWLSSRYGSFRDLGYGYQWWSARIGEHHFNYASGHGGSYIILLDELDMIIVTTADPLYGPELASGGGWEFERAINEVVGSFVKALP